MVDYKTNCKRQVIVRFLNDELGESEQMDFESHLESCESCRNHLTLTSAGKQWWSDAKEMLCQDEANSELLETLSFLNPTDDPRMMGRFGGYEIAGLIGQGGMGIVLKGFDKSLNRYSAIKVLAPQLATRGSARNRFAREAQAAAAVVHDNVIAIHGVSESAGLPYLVMPYVRGESLQKRLDRDGAMTPLEIIRIAHQVASGLAAAHSQGLVHRDVKPANILLPEGVERVLLTDFGLARAVDDSKLTGTGTIAGTPQFMSPEQARGDDVDPRSDLFSLGTVMYAMCTGRNPFRANNAFSVLRRIIEDQPRPIRQINNHVPAWLQIIVDRLLAKSPENRYRKAQEVADLLEHCLAHLQNPTVPLPGELGTNVGNSKFRKWIGVGTVASAVAIVGMWSLFPPKEKGTLTLANLEDKADVLIAQDDTIGNKSHSNTGAGPSIAQNPDNLPKLENGPDSQAQEDETQEDEKAEKLHRQREQEQLERSKERIVQLTNQISSLQREGNFLEAKAVEKTILIELRYNDKDFKELTKLRLEMAESRLNGNHEIADQQALKIRKLSKAINTRYCEIDRLIELENKAKEKLDPLRARRNSYYEQGKDIDGLRADKEIEKTIRRLLAEFESEVTTPTRDTNIDSTSLQDEPAYSKVFQLKSSLLDAKIDIENSKHTLAQAETTFEQTQKLFSKGFVNKAQLDSDEARLVLARLEHERARIAHKDVLQNILASKEDRGINSEVTLMLLDAKIAKEKASHSLDQAKDSLRHTQTLIDRGFATEEQLASDKSKVQLAQLRFEKEILKQKNVQLIVETIREPDNQDLGPAPASNEMLKREIELPNAANEDGEEINGNDHPAAKMHHQQIESREPNLEESKVQPYKIEGDGPNKSKQRRPTKGAGLSK